MTQKEKKLLLTDLSARLPYVVIVEYGCKHEGKDLGERQSKLTGRMIDSFFGSMPIGMSEVYSLQPYLRPMSSMTVEEKKEYNKFYPLLPRDLMPPHIALQMFDWLNAPSF